MPKVTEKVNDTSEIYYDYIYLENKAWTKYGIPVSFIDPKTKYCVEGLIYGPKKRKRDKNCKVKIYYNFDSIYLQQPVDVPCEHIFVSKRQLTRMENGTETISQVVPGQEPRKARPLSFDEISNIFTQYKGVNWTIPELAAILERNSDSYSDISKLPFLGKVSTRNCRITNSMQDTYTISTPEPMTIEQVSSISIEKLEKEYTNCKRCSLSDERIKSKCNIVHGRGNKTSAKIFLIGEAPGTTERDTGIAFNPSAPAGETLFRVMSAAGINQETDCYITNSVWCWPPAEEEGSTKNGKPSDEHISLCSNRLKTELVVLKPKVIVLLGAIAYKAFFGRFLKGPIGASLGWLPKSGDYNVYLMYHPSFIIRQLNFERDPDKKAGIKQEYLERFIEIKTKSNEYQQPTD